MSNLNLLVTTLQKSTDKKSARSYGSKVNFNEGIIFATDGFFLTYAASPFPGRGTVDAGGPVENTIPPAITGVLNTCKNDPILFEIDPHRVTALCAGVKIGADLLICIVSEGKMFLCDRKDMGNFEGYYFPANCVTKAIHYQAAKAFVTASGLGFSNEIFGSFIMSMAKEKA